MLLIIAAAAIAICFAAAQSFAADNELVYHETEAEAAEDLREQMVQREGKVTIGFKAETDEAGLKKMIGSIMDEAISHTGEPKEGDYIAFQYASYKGQGRTDMNGATPVVVIEYDISYFDDADQEAETDEKVSEIIDGLELDDASDYEKICAVYDYICANVEYEAAEDDSNIRRTAYGALVEGKAVCQGYSVSLYRLLLEAGIDNRIIHGEGIPDTGESNAHTWNIVKLDGKYYYMDVTWGDAMIGNENFLRPAGAGFEEEHVADEKFTGESFTEQYPMAEERYEPEQKGVLEKLSDLAKGVAEGISNLFHLIKGLSL